jgi:hypothetical protein
MAGAEVSFDGGVHRRPAPSPRWPAGDSQRAAPPRNPARP